MGARILVVNDDQDILELFRDLLEGEGYEATLFSFAPHDLEHVERAQPDLIILDYIFGSERIGWQLLQKIKMRRTTAKIPIIICTAATREVREIEGYLQAHSISLVAKPFDIDELLRAVAMALANNSYYAIANEDVAIAEPTQKRDKESRDHKTS